MIDGEGSARAELGPSDRSVQTPIAVSEAAERMWAMASIPYSLRPLLDVDPALVTPDQLDRLIGQAESQQADWKRQINSSKDDILDLACDVAGFANATGGLVVVGLDENDRSEAETYVGVTPDAKRTDFADWVNAVVRAKVSPYAPFSVHRVEGPGGLDVVLIAVDPGEAAPYAVTEGVTLRYPVRVGTGKTYLSEPEVAEWYGRRLRRIADQDHRTDELRVAAVPEAMLAGDAAWLVVTLAPARPGGEVIASGDVERYRDLLTVGELRRFPLDMPSPWNPRVGHRSILAVDNDESPSQRAVLGVDGSGSAAICWSGNADGTVPHNLRFLTQETMWLVSTLVANAIERGASGTATLSIEVMVRPELTLQMVTGDRSHQSMFSDTPSHLGPVQVGRRTIDLAAVASSMRELLAVTHLLAVDVASAFGFAKLPGLGPDGTITPYDVGPSQFDRHTEGKVIAWAQENDVPYLTDSNSPGSLGPGS
jgi:hypothetical protein